jgi:predicted aldo/keto reductase-like oxidoreductase
LSTPGVTTVNLGAHNQDQVRKNVEMVKSFQPLSPEEQTRLTELGKELAQKWGPHFGPVA